MKLRWKIYCFVVLLQALGFPLSVFILKASLNVADLVNWIFIVIGAIGLYSYVFNKKIGRPSFWGCFLYVFFAWDIFYQFVWQPFFMEVVFPPGAWAFTAVIAAFIIPQYLAIFRLSKNNIPP